MGVFQKDGHWFMLYTALSQRGLMQTTGLATSPDLIHWTKSKTNPVIKADPRWYEAVQKGNYRVDWRDPHVVVKDGVCHGFICARQNQGLLNRRGCAGYFTSKNGHHWQVKPPACTPSNCFDWECPSVFEADGRFYMVAIAGGPGRQVYRVAERIEGPYRRMADDTLLPSGNFSVRPCVWRGKLHLFHWQRGLRDWGANGGGGYAMLASPKAANVVPDGALSVESFDWSSLYRSRRKEIGARTPAAPSCGTWRWSRGLLRASRMNGPAIWLTQRDHEDFILCADLALNEKNPAKEFGLVFRADTMGDQGMYATVIPGRFSAELVKYVYNRRRGPDSLWRGRSVEQTCHVAPVADRKYRLRVIVFGPSIEFNINGRLVLARMNLPRRNGRAGLFIEDGEAVFSDISIQPLSAPKCNWEF